MLDDLQSGILGRRSGEILCHRKHFVGKVPEDTIVFISRKTRCFVYIRLYFIIRILYKSATVDTSEEWKVELENSLWLSISSS